MKFNWKIGKDKWLILLAVGLLLLVLTIPSGPETEKKMLKDAASGTEASLPVSYTHLTLPTIA